MMNVPSLRTMDASSSKFLGCVPKPTVVKEVNWKTIASRKDVHDVTRVQPCSVMSLASCSMLPPIFVTSFKLFSIKFAVPLAIRLVSISVGAVSLQSRK